MRAAGLTLGAVFTVTAVLRRSKPLHPEGAVAQAVLEVSPAGPSSGITLVDAAGRHDCVVRASYAMGAGPRWPDIEGFALRVGPDAAGGVEDVLFASTGVGPTSRHVLLVRPPGRHRTQTTLLPVRAGGRPVVLRLEPADADTQPWPTAYELSWAHAGGIWHPFGRLSVAGWDTGDAPTRFDPVTNPLRGTTQYAVVEGLREPAYRLARRAWSAARGPALVSSRRRRSSS
jgi:hypothetical protein